MWTFAWLFVLEAVAITVANAATIVIFTRTRRLHNKQYIMIISQAVADLFVGLVSVSMFTVAITDKQALSSSLFKKVISMEDTFLGLASLSGLAALAIERAHATYFPFRHATLGKGPYIIGIVLMWTAPFVVVGPRIFNVGDTYTFKTPFIISVLVIIFAAYSLIVLKVRCTTTQTHDATIQENKRLTATLAIVTILSLVMWLPYPIYRVIDSERSLSLTLFSVKFLHYGNSLVNSVVYAFRMREIKREILRVFQCCRRNQISTNNESDVGTISLPM